MRSLIAVAVVGVLVAGCEPGAAPAPSAPPSTVVSPSSVPSGRPVTYARALPDCTALAALLAPATMGLAGTPTDRPGQDGWREWVTCTASSTSARVEVHIERPLLEPVEGQPLATYLSGRPEKLIKDRCPDFPYTPVAELNHGFACYVRKSDAEAQGLVAAATADGTALVTVTVSDAARTPADLRAAAEAAARSVATSIVKAV
jgi:hypothetical protein